MIEETICLQSATTISFQMPSEDITKFLPKASPVALFIGAGASVPLCMPTMNDFRKRFSDGLSGDLKVLWNNVVVLTGKYYEVEQDRVDIEQVLTYIETSLFSYSKLMTLWRNTLIMDEGDRATIQELENFRQQLLALRLCILDKICTTYTWPDSSKTTKYCEPLFRMLVEVTGQSTTNVFTTNYDLTFETLANERPADYEISDGFQETESGEETWINNYVPKYRSDNSIILWKLHGSTSWKGNWAKKELRKAAPSTYLQDDESTVIIYPTKTKARTQDLFARPFNQAYGGLKNLFSKREVKVLLVIGYGFGDDEVRSDIEEGLMMENDTKLIVVDPGANICKLSRYFPKIDPDRINVINSYFGENDTIEEIRSALREFLNT